MYILNIIDKIYENSYFQTCLIGATIILILLFIIVLILGIKDSKKSKEPKKIAEEDVKDVTFEMPADSDNIKEDVTFEMPVLTKNLEDFKKNLEEEIQKEDEAVIRKTSGTIENKDSKPIKILDAHEIEDTAIVHLKELENQKNNTSETSKESKNVVEKEKPAINNEKHSLNIFNKKTEQKPMNNPPKKEEPKKDTSKEKRLEMLVINPLKHETKDNKKIENSIDEEINTIEKDSISDMYDSEDDF